jgi:hypothetical protein
LLQVNCGSMSDRRVGDTKGHEMKASALQQRFAELIDTRSRAHAINDIDAMPVTGVEGLRQDRVKPSRHFDIAGWSNAVANALRSLRRQSRILIPKRHGLRGMRVCVPSAGQPLSE